MSEPATSQEPTMEEILASIRKIISEDDEPQAEAAPPPPPPPPPAPEPAVEMDQSAVDDMFSSDIAAVEPERTPEPEPMVLDQPLELTQPIMPEPVGDIVAVEPVPVEPLVEARTERAATVAFNQLASNVMIATEDGMTLEDIVRSMLKPMLKDWLDRHLAQIVDEKVQAEVERLARRGRRF